jgi:hypothetical protein
MMFNTQDIETLEIFAYNRLIVRRFAEALPVYGLLSQLESRKHKWQLASVLCLWQLGSLERAKDSLAQISALSLPPAEKKLFSRLFHAITHASHK